MSRILPNGQGARNNFFAYLALEAKKRAQHGFAMKAPNRIREWREARDFTLEGLAEAAGFSPSYMSRMESGVRNVSIKNLLKIASALDVSVRDLVPNAPIQADLVGYVAAGSAAVL